MVWWVLALVPLVLAGVAVPWFRRHRQRRRARLLAEPFPTDWLGYLHQNVPHYRYLSDAEQATLRDSIRIFVAEKQWEGCGGLQMTDEIQVTIAAQACLLVLSMDHNYFDRVLSILVYPFGYKAPTPEQAAGGIVPADGSARLGEAHYRGPVILSWADVIRDARHPRAGKNLVFHEFAHQLDMLDGVVDGTPPLKDSAQAQRWKEVMTREYQDLREASATGRATLLDDYGATNEAEFFAVATECFFDLPIEMARTHAGLYDLLREYYRQDPAARCAAKKHS